MHFKNKIVWITGASSGIGKELAIQLSKENAILILTSRNEVALEELKVQLLHNAKIHLLPFDLTQIDLLDNLTRKALNLEGKIDYVIQCAGVSQRSLAMDTNLDVYQRIMDINYFAPLAITKALLPYFIKKDEGHFVVISSVAGLYGFPLRSGYVASKHALKGFMETIQTELYKTNIKSTIVFPGRIDTPISKNALTGQGEKSQKEDANNKVGMHVTICARKIIKGIKSNKKNVYIGLSERLLFWIWWFFPNLYLKIANNKGLKN